MADKEQGSEDGVDPEVEMSGMRFDVVDELILPWDSHYLR